MVGQHIRILKGGRWLHAIDCGDETVLHLVEETPPPRVRRAYRPEFVAGAEAVEIVTHRERTFPAKEIVKRAYSRASDPTLAAMFHDSEAFVEWCTTGRLAGARNVALEVPGLAPTAPKPSPAKANGKTPPPATRAKGKVAAKPATRPATAPRRAATKAKAKPAPKAKAKAAPRSKPAAKKAQAKAPARKAAARKKPARAARKGRP